MRIQVTDLLECQFYFDDVLDLKRHSLCTDVLECQSYFEALLGLKTALVVSNNILHSVHKF